MASRTNKMGILKKKMQQAKQKKSIGGPKSNFEGIKKEFENPKSNKYIRFFRVGKWVCDTTGVREDPDGYRLKRKPNCGEVEFEYRGESSFGFRRWRRKAQKIGIK